MGTNSTFFRFHEKHEKPNRNNVSRFGEPAYSLFTSTRYFTLHHHIDVTTADGNVRYSANTKYFTLHDTTEITDSDGKYISTIRRKLLSLHERHFVKMYDGMEFQLSNEFFHLIKDVTNIEGLGWQLRGNVWELNFELYDGNDNVIAVVGQKLVSIHDKYCVDIYRPEYEAVIVSILITLQHMIADRERSRNARAASANSSNNN